MKLISVPATQELTAAVIADAKGKATIQFHGLEAELPPTTLCRAYLMYLETPIAAVYPICGEMDYME